MHVNSCRVPRTYTPNRLAGHGQRPAVVAREGAAITYRGLLRASSRLSRRLGAADSASNRPSFRPIALIAPRYGRTANVPFVCVCVCGSRLVVCIRATTMAMPATSHLSE